VVGKAMLERTRVKETIEPYEVATLSVKGCSHHSEYLNGDDMTHEGGMISAY
jgi:3-hydroxybutyrate dehydrogenase